MLAVPLSADDHDQGHFPVPGSHIRTTEPNHTFYLVSTVLANCLI
jgi:hypothetical protein